MSGEKNPAFTAVVGGREFTFESVWKNDEDLLAVAVWDAHDLSDVEILWWARTYLDGPFADELLLPYETYEDSLDDMPAVDAWPGFGDDTAKWVRRAWARWRETTVEEAEASLEWMGDPLTAGDPRWVESAVPGEGLRPVAVVTLGGDR